MGSDMQILAATRSWFDLAYKHKYGYHFEHLGRPIIQYPQDIVAMQEIIWETKPDLIIASGIAHGGSLILSASMLALLDYADAVNGSATLNPLHSKRKVIGIDIDIRPHNREAIEKHPMSHLVEMIQGSSIDQSIIAQVHEKSSSYKRILVFLDSNHTHDHVLAELAAYAPLVSRGSYCCVFGTVVEDLPAGMSPNRPWGKGNNPKTAVREFMKRLSDNGLKDSDGNPLDFVIDRAIPNKLLITVAPDGYLRRT
ncbi:MAG: cephalosporin hydroxylase family protein [Spirochaetes bacterium]|nr:cephalosporin hydroxylase family protein [Spirochaetota bacterium]